MDFSQDLVRGSIIPIVLALLNERPMYGYEIVKVVNARTGGRLEWKEGTLYPALHSLQADRLVTARWAEAPGAGAPGRLRKYYSITRRGRAELARRSEEWRQFSFAVNAILLGGAA
jgi:DNA-binding PadR family transcriptional regulator